MVWVDTNEGFRRAKGSVLNGWRALKSDRTIRISNMFNIMFPNQNFLRPWIFLTPIPMMMQLSGMNTSRKGGMKVCFMLLQFWPRICRRHLRDTVREWNRGCWLLGGTTILEKRIAKAIAAALRLGFDEWESGCSSRFVSAATLVLTKHWNAMALHWWRNFRLGWDIIMRASWLSYTDLKDHVLRVGSALVLAKWPHKQKRFV